MTNVTFEEKIAYEIGVKLAHEAYMEKEASLQATKALASGLKGVATGQGATMGQAFRKGVQQSGYTGAQGFRGVAQEIGQGLAKPWQDMYKRYGAGRVNKLRNAEAAAVKDMRALERSGTATEQQLRAAGDRVINAGTQSDKALKSFGTMKDYRQTMQRGYMPRNAQGQVDYGQLGTMAAGVGLAGTGAYMAGNAAFGGGTPQPQQQVAPHQYYLNQLSSYFGG